MGETRPLPHRDAARASRKKAWICPVKTFSLIAVADTPRPRTRARLPTVCDTIAVGSLELGSVQTQLQIRGKAIMNGGMTLCGTTVLLLEDEALVNMSTTAMLEDLGCSVRSFIHLADAVRGVADWTPEVAVLDVSVSGEKSFEFARMLHDRGVPVAFLTGYDVASVREAGFECPYCQKPCRMAALETAIVSALQVRNES